MVENTYMFLAHLSLIFSIVSKKKQLIVVSGVDFAGGIFGRQESMMSGHRINTTNGDDLVSGYILE
jgi:hypothetical protein